MDIPKIQSGVPGAWAPAGIRKSGNLEVTISDRGVDFSRPDRAPAPGRPPAQVTSDPSLQSLLSAEETRALAEQFSSFRKAPESAGKTGLYNGRGGAMRLPPLGGPQGQMIDVVG